MHLFYKLQFSRNRLYENRWSRELLLNNTISNFVINKLSDMPKYSEYRWICLRLIWSFEAISALINERKCHGQRHCVFYLIFVSCYSHLCGNHLGGFHKSNLSCKLFIHFFYENAGFWGFPNRLLIKFRLWFWPFLFGARKMSW